MKSQFFLLVVAIIAGAVLPIQAGLNIVLGKSVHQPIFAAFASFLVGTIALFIYLLIIKFDFHSIANVKSVSPTVWLAGILGAFYVAVVIIVAPQLGASLAFGLIIGGQLLVSLILEHYGLLGLPEKPINLYRILGVIMLVAGVVLVRKF